MAAVGGSSNCPPPPPPPPPPPNNNNNNNKPESPSLPDTNERTHDEEEVHDLFEASLPDTNEDQHDDEEAPDLSEASLPDTSEGRHDDEEAPDLFEASFPDTNEDRHDEQAPDLFEASFPDTNEGRHDEQAPELFEASFPDTNEDRHDDVPDLFEERMHRQFENMNLLDQVELLAQSYSFLDHLDDFDDDDDDDFDDDDIEPEQLQITGDSDDDLELQGAAAAPDQIFFTEDDCLEDLPEKFDGNSDMLGPFMYQCQLFMERSNRDFSVDRVRVCFVTSMLIGRAARWATAKLQRCTYLMHNYTAFMMELKHVFEDPQRREAAKRKIRRLRQGPGPVVDYSNAFQMIAQDLDWTEPALMDQFQEGLNPEIRAELSRQEAPDTLAALITACIHIERRLTRDAAAANKPDSPRALVMPPTNQSDPTEPVGGARMRLTKEEKERRRKMNLCLYCGNGGHFADTCPAKASKNSPPGNSPAPL